MGTAQKALNPPWTNTTCKWHPIYSAVSISNFSCLSSWDTFGRTEKKKECLSAGTSFSTSDVGRARRVEAVCRPHQGHLCKWHLLQLSLSLSAASNDEHRESYLDWIAIGQKSLHWHGTWFFNILVWLIELKLQLLIRSSLIHFWRQGIFPLLICLKNWWWITCVYIS